MSSLGVGAVFPDVRRGWAGRAPPPRSPAVHRAALPSFGCCYRRCISGVKLPQICVARVPKGSLPVAMD